MRRTFVDITLLVAGTVIAGVWLAHVAPVWWGHDMPHHARWQVHFAGQLAQGDLYPRWLAGMNEGFGSPAFFIYPPLAHYLTALLAPWWEPVTRVQLSMLAAVAASALAMYAWARTLATTRLAACAAALVYALAPYHLYIDAYRRVALAEVWAFAWAPLALWLLAAARPRGIAAAVLGASLPVAALFATHAPSALVLVPLVIALAALQPGGGGARALAAAVAASLLGASLAAGYLGTALTHQAFIRMDLLYGEGLTYPGWLMFKPGSIMGCGPEFHPFACQLVQVFGLQFGLAAVLAAFALIVSRERERERERGRRRRRMVWALVAANVLVAFLLTAWSEPLWALLPLLQKVQFPFRLMVAQTLSLAALLVLAAPGAAADAPRGARQVHAALALVSVLAVIATQWVFAQADQVRAPQFAEYARRPVLDGRDAPEYQLADPKRLEPLFGQARWAVLEGDAHVRVLAWQPRRILLQLRATVPTRIVLRQFHYTGWQVRVGDTVRPAAALSAELPVPVLAVPAGEHAVLATLPPTWGESAGRVLAWLAVAAWLALAAWTLRARSPRGVHMT